MDSINIDDIGNVIVEGCNDDADRYILIIRTVLGVSRILEIGPIQDGVKTSCSASFTQMDYDDRKVDKIIDKFLNDGKCITQVQTFGIDKMDEITKTLPNIVELLYD